MLGHKVFKIYVCVMFYNFNNFLILFRYEYTIHAVPEGSLIGNFNFYKSFLLNPSINSYLRFFKYKL
jgi:hypothetical protein